MKVAVLMGGMSAEREISLETGKAIALALRTLGNDVIEVDVDSNLPLRISRERPDVAFIALHGRLGEDGSVQGLLEVMRIPYTGSGLLSSALAMNKEYTKKILDYHGFPVVPGIAVRRTDGFEDVSRQVETGIHFPVIVKPSQEGSSIGVSKVNSPSELKESLDLVFSLDTVALVEKYIDGRLLTVGIVGDVPVILPVLEIIPKEGFYDYKNKYEPGRTNYEVPARIDENIAREAKELSRDVFKLLECEGIGRVDLMLENSSGNLYILEINTIPGMTETSLIPKAGAAAGISFEELVQMVLEAARLTI
ncbi:MAG: D-alanine--D-alanine ligase [Actinomycetota bacterium]|nr:D-alanine--D-alanine ligase [Actinomycetota bacterium]